MLRRLALLMIVAACGKDSPPTPPAPPTSVDGWWQVADVPAADDIHGAALRLGPREMAVVAADGRVVVRTCATTQTGTTFAITGCDATVSGTIAGDTLTFARGFTATRIPADRTAALDQQVATGGPPPEICARARQCFRDGTAALGSPGDEAFEFGADPDPSQCERTARGVVMLLGDRPIPPSCAGLDRATSPK